MIKILTKIILFICFMLPQVSAASISDQVRRELDKLKGYIKKEETETEKDIVNKKQEVIKVLERTKNKMIDANLRMLVDIQLSKYRKEITAAEDQINNLDVGDREKKSEDNDERQKLSKEASKVVDFEVPYFYKHPVENFKKEIGEFKFYENGSVICYHRLGEEVLMFKKWSWDIKDGKLFIEADRYHGPIYVTKKSPREIYLNWQGKVGKKNVAKQK